MKKHTLHRVRANLYISRCKSVKARITKYHYCLKDITNVNRPIGTYKFRKKLQQLKQSRKSKHLENLTEYDARAVIGETQILVYRHKTRRGGPARIHTDADDLNAIKSYLENHWPISESEDEPLFLTPGKLLSCY